MRKIKRLVLHEISGANTLSADAMRSISGGSPHVYIYSCVCYNIADGSRKYETIKVMSGTNPETAILGSNAPCYGYSSATCAYSAMV